MSLKSMRQRNHFISGLRAESRDSLIAKYLLKRWSTVGKDNACKSVSQEKIVTKHVFKRIPLPLLSNQISFSSIIGGPYQPIIAIMYFLSSFHMVWADIQQPLMPPEVMSHLTVTDGVSACLNKSVVKPESAWGYAWLAILPVWTCLANGLVVATFMWDRSLRRNLANVIIASLSVADFFVALLVIPLAIYFKVRRNKITQAVLSFWLKSKLIYT